MCCVLLGSSADSAIGQGNKTVEHHMLGLFHDGPSPVDLTPLEASQAVSLLSFRRQMKREVFQQAFDGE